MLKSLMPWSNLLPGFPCCLLFQPIRPGNLHQTREYRERRWLPGSHAAPRLFEGAPRGTPVRRSRRLLTKIRTAVAAYGTPARPGPCFVSCYL